jgi:DNA-binding NarL/FixJ family response regulator
MGKIRVFLVDDHALMCEGLRALLSYYSDVEVVGDVRDGAQAIAQVGQLRPDVVLMDIAMPGMNGIDATRVICEKYPDTRVLIVTQHDDRQYVVPLLQAGASGYILKRALGSDLVSALRAVARGETYLHPDVSAALVEEVRYPTESLTPREQEILEHIVRGETNSQIADNLSLSVKTVEWHRSNLMSKLDAHNAAELVRIALQYGLVDDGR